MSDEPRKATEVLLAIEAKIDTILSTVRASDLNVKVLSNKLNELMKSLDKLANTPKVTVEAVQTQPVVPNQAAVIFGQIPTNSDPSRTVVVTADSKLGVDDTPQGFRRTSRPESYDLQGDDSYLKKQGVPPPRSQIMPPGPKPPPGRSMGENVALPQPSSPPVKNRVAENPQSPSPVQKQATEAMAHGIIPVEQRVVDKNGKSVFLASVEVIDLSSGEQVSESRTNGTGKWMAALPVGQYKVSIKKLESLTKERIEAIQTITVDGSQSPLKLQMVIIK